MIRQIALDTETTGKTDDGTPGDHRIIEVGCVEIIDRKITGRQLRYLINPERPVDPEAAKVHGMTWEMLQNEPHFQDIATTLIDFIRGSELLIHNAKFDVSFLDMEFSRMGLSERVIDMARVTDTMALALQLMPGHQVNLDNLCNILGINNKHRTLHGALLDSQILAEVYLAMTGGQGNFDLSIEESNNPTARWHRSANVRLPIMGVEVSRHAQHVNTLINICQGNQIGTEQDQPIAGSMWGQEYQMPLLKQNEGESKGDFKQRQKEQRNECLDRLLNEEEKAALKQALAEDAAAYKEWEDRVLGRAPQQAQA